MAKKVGTILYHDWIDPLSDIPEGDFKSFIIAILDYDRGVITQAPEFGSKEARMASKFVFPQIDRAKRNAENGSKGGHATQETKALLNIGSTDGSTDGSSTNTNTITNTDTYTNTETDTITSTKTNKNKRKVSAKADTETFSKEFESLWEIYPKKIGKKQALQAYIKARKGGETFEAVERGINAYKRHLKINKTEPQFTKNGSTWFNGNAWNDDYNTHGGYCSTTTDDSDLDGIF